MTTINEKVYHGTTTEKANNIISTNKYIPGEENVNDQFLGKGIYFFRDKQHAVMWNLKHARDNKLGKLPYKKYIEEYSVLESELEYKRKNMLDLNDMNDVAKYNKVCKKIKNIFLSDEDYESAEYKDRAIINYLYKKNCMDEIYVIRKISGQRANVDKLNAADFIQRDILCVKDDKIIKDIGNSIKIEVNEYNNIKAVSF